MPEKNVYSYGAPDRRATVARAINKAVLTPCLFETPARTLNALNAIPPFALISSFGISRLSRGDTIPVIERARELMVPTALLGTVDEAVADAMLHGFGRYDLYVPPRTPVETEEDLLVDWLSRLQTTPSILSA